MFGNDSRIRLVRDLAAAQHARRHVRRFCAQMPTDLRATAQLLTSELVTNAVQHGRGQVELLLTDCGDSIRVEVIDESAERPHLLRASPGQVRGRGLMLVESFSSHWGVTALPGRPGKSVWFTLNTG
jgi:anti-sigma regulatory factor (Ser/Thr protein kinase)